MKKLDIYRLLEDKMLSYSDYVDIPVTASDELLVPIPESSGILVQQIGADMQEYCGDVILVRESVLKKLTNAARLLKSYNSSLQLEVVYGYRAPEIQTKLFETYREKLCDQYEGRALLAAVHRLIAVPDVAGHPAGAAVDIQITDKRQPLEFGTKIWEFVQDSYTFSPFISRCAWENRQLLRRIMMSAGFAPFDGEWWHFSYGDKEWARYYNVKDAIYKQYSMKIVPR